MKVYLDDIRNPPDDTWIIARNYNQAINLLKTGKVTEISFDHDLGLDSKSGYDVMVFLEEMVFRGKLPKPIIHVHTANSSARTKMVQCAGAISLF